MHETFFKTLDPYQLRARVMPALLVVLPGALAVAAWFPEKLALLSGLLGFIAVFGAFCFISECIRDRGKELEKTLIDEWGGLPSTTILRHRDGHLNPTTKERIHQKLKELLPGTQIPSREEEEDNPDGADVIYGSCGDFLREQTRDPQKFSLLLSENIQYGTRRNLLGAKPIALWIAIPSLLSCGAALWFAIRKDSPFEVALSCTLITLLCLISWLARVNHEWVKTTAFTYAERLLAACDNLNPIPNTKNS